jgi:hypothetical protein
VHEAIACGGVVAACKIRGSLETSGSSSDVAVWAVLFRLLYRAASLRAMMDKNYLVEIQRFVNDGGQLTHEQSVRFLKNSLNKAVGCPTTTA